MPDRKLRPHLTRAEAASKCQQPLPAAAYRTKTGKTARHDPTTARPDQRRGRPAIYQPANSQHVRHPGNARRAPQPARDQSGRSPSSSGQAAARRRLVRYRRDFGCRGPVMSSELANRCPGLLRAPSLPETARRAVSAAEASGSRGPGRHDACFASARRPVQHRQAGHRDQAPGAYACVVACCPPSRRLSR
jgi:hypothetical protein